MRFHLSRVLYPSLNFKCFCHRSCDRHAVIQNFQVDIAVNTWPGVMLSTTSRAYVMQATRDPVQHSLRMHVHMYAYSSAHTHTHGHTRPTPRFTVLEVALRYARDDLI